MGVRIFQLAKELGMSSKDLMEYLRTQGHQISNHMSSVEDSVATILKDRLPRPGSGQTKKDGKAKTAEKSANGGTATATAEAKTRRVKDGSSKSASPKKADSARTDTTRKGRSGRAGVAVAEKAPGRGDRSRRSGDGRTSSEGDKDKAKARPKATRRRFFPGAGDYSYDSGGKRVGGPRRSKRSDASPRTPSEASIQLPMTVKELSSAIGLRVPDLMKTLVSAGKMLTINSSVDEESLNLLGEAYSIKLTIQQEELHEDRVKELETFESDPEKLVTRAPIVTFLGHVDHGKTSLLDFIRNTKVTDKEHGGITQHLGAYRVDDKNVHVVFIDTPGHKAFTEMRARGANATDLAVLVVAADEGPMPQTEEAYNHAKAAGVKIVVALNKIDRPNANAQAAMDKLSRLGVMPVSWGGDTEFVEVSAITGQGVDGLLETLSLEAEILELKANPERSAVGVVLEAEPDAGRGNVATILVQDGTLRTGDYILCGLSHGKVRNMWLNGTTVVKEAGPSTPIQITGLSRLPEVGEKFYALDVEKAKAIADERQDRREEEGRISSPKVTLQNLWEQLEQAEVKELRIILKADVKGTLEALGQQLEGAGNEEVQVKVIHTGVGTVSQDDILLADASSAIVFGFNVGSDDRARAYAEEKGVEVRVYNVIYELLDEVKRAIESRLAPTLREEVQGRVEILQVFKASKIGNIAGCIVRKGNVFRDSQVRVIRSNQVLHTGKLGSLKRFKEDVKEVKEGFECGLKVANFDDVREGDFVEAFTIIEEKRSL